MKRLNHIVFRATLGIMFAFSIAANASAASWNGIEPFKSTRADVVKILGQPIGESPDGVLRFPVMGGSAQVSFVSEKFVTAKKLKPQLVGTVLEIVLQFLSGFGSIASASAQPGGVAYMAHVGGFAAGFLLTFLFRGRGEVVQPQA